MSSSHDRAVLNCIFNPLLPTTEAAFDEDLSLVLKDEEEEESEVVQRAKELEVEGVKEAERGHVSRAIEVLSEAIRVAPARPSGYNNRAQAYRLIGEDSAAFADLSTAIALSRGTGRSGCQALCQRGLLHRKLGRLDEAKADFTRASLLGSQFAKQQLIETNPYAAMCNQMLHDVMAKMFTPPPSEHQGA